MCCPTLKSRMKYRRHLSITAIQEAYKGSYFSFSTVEKVDVIREMKKLNKKKAIHDDDIPVKILKENVSFFAENICIFTIIQQRLREVSLLRENGKCNSYFQKRK